MHAVVIGGGIIGMATAWNLAKSGAQVTMLEARGFAGGTSSTSFAWLNSSSKTPYVYHRLNVAGMAEHRAVAEELGNSPWLHWGGNLIWDSSNTSGTVDEPDVPARGESLMGRVNRLKDWDYPVTWMTRSDVIAEQPEIRVPEYLERAAWFSAEGYCDVPLLVAYLARNAAIHGASLQPGTRVTKLLIEHNRVTGVETSSGENIVADVVVSCAGRWTDQVLAMAGSVLPMAPTHGLLVTTSKVPTTLTSLVHTPDVNLRPEGGSRLLLASYDIDARVISNMSEQVLDGMANEILDRARQIVPTLAWASVEARVVGTRSIPADGSPAVGWMPELEGFYTMATHSGVTMGPLLGRIAAAEILGNRLDPLLETFRPARLLADRTAQTVDT